MLLDEEKLQHTEIITETSAAILKYVCTPSNPFLTCTKHVSYLLYRKSAPEDFSGWRLCGYCSRGPAIQADASADRTLTPYPHSQRF